MITWCIIWSPKTRYPYFIMRVMLAAIDHNMHLSRKPKLTNDGKEQGHRKYSKRSQKFHAEVVKEEKQYSYFPFLVSKMLQRRSVYEGSFTLPSDRNSFDPKQIAPTLGIKEPPPTEELLKGPSRFDKKSMWKTTVHYQWMLLSASKYNALSAKVNTTNSYIQTCKNLSVYYKLTGYV